MPEHVVSTKTHTAVFVALLILLALSIGTAQLDLGAWTTVMALGVSVFKTMLIVVFFMHILYSSALTRLLAIAGLLWFGILMTLTLSDYQTRSWHAERSAVDRPAALDRALERTQ